MNMLIRLLEQYGFISAACKEAIQRHTQIYRLRKGEFLLAQSGDSPSVFALEQGYLRGFYQKNSRTYDLWFAFEHQLIGSSFQMYRSRTQKQNIQCMEDSTIYALPNSIFMRLIQEFPELNALARRATEHYCLSLEQRIMQLQVSTPVERFITFVQHYGPHNKRIALENQASYLGVSSEELLNIIQLLEKS